MKRHLRERILIIISRLGVIKFTYIASNISSHRLFIVKHRKTNISSFKFKIPYYFRIYISRYCVFIFLTIFRPPPVPESSFGIPGGPFRAPLNLYTIPDPPIGTIWNVPDLLGLKIWTRGVADPLSIPPIPNLHRNLDTVSPGAPRPAARGRAP